MLKTKKEEKYPASLIEKYGLLSNGKLDVGVASLAQLLENKENSKK